ncbi:short-chain dehydrogenase [Mesorhizobium hungaricum]|jgi:NAD(P)-dependent dehydrogenase (short-subunit alcohol dehydrogenase family)|uniref:Short-chain dehydrogenase n=1 Tax=Mesorhizobium hungaricum TaxID=1566387 RepID=A0A1C2E739_9HYPH|nr:MULTISPECIES: SDR family oxidoreductase [Mesorhizobium]MBN9237354.1 SDR family oxidoreductase [Mesorhizobium sp.]MDQ0333280.1 NAD(P)-dependent dehydrogenase (short-subunit alcohol dehydrogenase family) [Mesorhizobium sp. YL-MeA3-2017]OCX22809.1 short-chain dehydrogenase [Mesorhizobium hungaricum]
MATTVIYGGSGGIGTAILGRITERGESVHLVGRDTDRLQKLAVETGATFTAVDVLTPGSFERVASEVHGPINGLVYAVGSINLKPIGRLTEDDFVRDFRLNAVGAALAMKAHLPSLKQSRAASVVLISSVAASQGFAAHASVSMAKAALEGLTFAMAAELAPAIRVNCVAPSLTRTPLSQSLTNSPQVADAIAQLHAMRRLGEPDDIAAFVDFLLSPEAGWITGQVIGVDGGRSRLRTKG